MGRNRIPTAAPQPGRRGGGGDPPRHAQPPREAQQGSDLRHAAASRLPEGDRGTKGGDFLGPTDAPIPHLRMAAAAHQARVA
eukprot:15035764-Alexandrium_andersonii.AAC.1